jgi:3-polyprenyl-4-hydroxybenzoate decarboxylase
MAFPDLRAFLDQLRRDGDLAVVDAPVDARLEAAEIHRRVIAADGPALLFTRVQGSDFPLATNLFGTRRRAEMAFGARPLELVRRMAALARTALPPSAGTLWRERDLLGAALRIGTRGRARGPVTEVVTRHAPEPPARVTYWPETGPFITLPPPHGTEGNPAWASTGCVTTRATVLWQIGKGSGFHCARRTSRGGTCQRCFPGGRPRSS